MALRSLDRPLNRRLSRHTTRMLGGARRPRPPNYLALACRAFEEVIRIDKRLRPFLEEQRRLVENYLRMQPWEKAIRKVYGPPDPAAPKPHYFTPPPPDIRQLKRDTKALAKTEALIALLASRLAQNR